MWKVCVDFSKLERFPILALAAAAAVAMALPSAALAQACVGSPALPGQFSLGGGVTFEDGGTGFEAQGRANLDGPISLGAGFGIIDLDNVDSNITTMNAGFAYDLATEGFAACPIAGVGYGTWSDSFQGVSLDISALSFPIGLGVGARVGEGGAAVLIPNAQAGLFFQRLKVSVLDGIDQFDETDSETEFFMSAGATLDFGQFFVRAGVSRTTVDDADTVLGLGVGIVF